MERIFQSQEDNNSNRYSNVLRIFYCSNNLYIVLFRVQKFACVWEILYSFSGLLRLLLVENVVL